MFLSAFYLFYSISDNSPSRSQGLKAIIKNKSLITFFSPLRYFIKYVVS